MAKRATSSQFYSVSELAAILSVHPSTVREQAAAGHLPAIRVGRVWRLPRKKIDAWMEEEHPAAEADLEMDAETRTWLDAGLTVAAQGITEAERDVPAEELQGWLQAMAHVVRPLEAEHV